MIQFEKHTLPNGARVILTHIPHLESVTTTITFGVGSRYETKPINGISHFLEHMMFKGTVNRPTTLEISKELDSVGAEYNAFTSKEMTSYYIKLASKHIDTALDMLQDVLKNSIFKAEEVIRERGVITEELNMYEDNPQVLAEELLESHVYGNTPMGWNIGGDKKTVGAVTRAKIVRYFNTYYQPNNMIISVVGNFDRKKTLERIKKDFSDLKRKAVPSYKKVTKTKKGPDVSLRYKKTEQAHLALGLKGFTYGHKDLTALRLLSIILGGNMSSRLFINIRERLGLCYYIRSGMNKYHDVGLFMIQAGLDTKRIHKAVESIVGELNILRTEGISKDELHKAKEFMKGKLALSFEESEQITSFLLTQEFYESSIKTPEERAKEIDKVTKEDVERVIARVITEDTLSLAIVGPYKNKQRFKKALKLAKKSV
jgi:predicted Zn-dependent peptidase